jgi:hypothetical protein
MATVQGWRNPQPEVIIQEQFDVAPDGTPLLPDNATVTPPPEYNTGTQYLAIVKNTWHVIDRPTPVFTLDYLKQKKLEELSRYKESYLNEPVTYDGHKFDADENSKNRLIQTYNTYQITNQLPPAWIDANNNAYPITSIDQIKGIIAAIAAQFQTRFFECNALRGQIMNAADEAALRAVVIPRLPMPF